MEKRGETARTWKVGAAGKKLQKTVVDGLAGRFRDCVAEKDCTLIRYDIIEGLRRLYEEVKDEKVREKAMELIETEHDDKYRKKYAGIRRVGRRPRFDQMCQPCEFRFSSFNP